MLSLLCEQAKHLQFVSGVRNSIYWMANLIWDCGICVVNIAVICIIVGGFRVEEFSDQNFLALFTLLVSNTLPTVNSHPFVCM